jgi:hypothetical protein
MTVANPTPQPSASTQSITALVLGALSLLCCPLLGPIAWYMGYQENKAIKEGRSPQTGSALALIGMILGILGTVYFVGVMLWIFFMGGLAALSAMMNR